ncbi:UDP-N-acetylglucosamine 2-epimerase [Carboxylicivirga sp. M1479]|uniref:UDP-N-acetylglucosamine 2-epimerase n=1 Tax=Carboxylicivirga sp. M1479 TaxID=2594476 RepID=UPI0011778EF7|nr:UDP-N-acetylglucosamine 2-epimerase [Carboxylicivirga sp. M1479]TRX70544.1 UDP-N-acetylglucosamine 2-epimerase (hydrolyzing) [Carboxylicivirga sp. M1479]
MNIAVLTSSRADYGIYLPLLKALQADESIHLHIIAFGTHLSPFHGHTLDQIKKDGFEVNYRVESMLAGDSANAVATAMSLTSLKFAEFWKDHRQTFDWVLCLGDRYEMFAAVMAGIPYGIKFAHLHGGERTLGAIDNIFRHSITLASSLHFVATAEFGARVKELIEDKNEAENKVKVVGALSLDNLKNMKLLSIEDFKERFTIDLSKPTILSTFHPETVNPEMNKEYAEIISRSFSEISERYQIVITLPNADTEGTVIRTSFLKLEKQHPDRVICVENFGTLGYFSCMKHCSMLIGNTSSGIIEAASFNKRVINLGNRQKGRACGDNVMHTPIDETATTKAVNTIEELKVYRSTNPYDRGGAVESIILTLKSQP